MKLSKRGWLLVLAEVTYRRRVADVSVRGVESAGRFWHAGGMRASEERAEAGRQPSWILARARRRAEAAAAPARWERR